MAQVKRKIPAILLAMIVAAVLALAAGISQEVYAADVELDKISFQGETSDDWWGHYYGIDGKSGTLDQSQLQIGVVDSNGQVIPAEAVKLTFCHTWYDESADRDVEKPAELPLGLAAEDPITEEGWNVMRVKAEALLGSGYKGSAEQEFIICDKYSMNFAAGDAYFEGVERQGWRMMDFFIVPKSVMAKPVVKQVTAEEPLTEKDYTTEYFTRVNDATDDRGLITEGGKAVNGMPVENGKYYVKITGVAPYYGERMVPFDIASSADPTYIKALTKKSKPVTVKYSKVKKSAQTIAAGKLIKLQNGIVLVQKNHFMGFKAYKKIKGAKCLSINASTGKVTVKKGTKKGVYKMTVELHPASIYETAAREQTVVDCWVKVK